MKGKKFIQCKYLLLFDLNNFDINIDSIDEAKEILDSKMESLDLYTELKISPKQMFWGHCSNIQVWAENNYDTRILHSNLAFPLLQRLVEVKDKQALKMFKKEIAKRLLKGYGNTIIYLYNEGFVDKLQRDEFWTIFSGNASILMNIENMINEWLKKKKNCIYL